MEALYYEVHISVRGNLTEDPQHPIRQFCKKAGLKCSSIVGEEPDDILTERLHTLNLASFVMEKTMMELSKLGVEVTREKIEAAIIDNRYNWDLA